MHYEFKSGLNLALLYYMLHIDRGTLNAEGIRARYFNVELINDRVREDFGNFFRENPFLFKDLFALLRDVEDTYTPDTSRYKKRWLHQSITSFIRDNFLKYDTYGEWFNDNETLQKLMNKFDTKQERFAFLSLYIGVPNASEALKDSRYHYFIFEGNVNPLAEKERIDMLKNVNLFDYIESLPRKLKEFENELREETRV